MWRRESGLSPTLSLRARATRVGYACTARREIKHSNPSLMTVSRDNHFRWEMRAHQASLREKNAFSYLTKTFLNGISSLFLFHLRSLRVRRPLSAGEMRCQPQFSKNFTLCTPLLWQKGAITLKCPFTGHLRAPSYISHVATSLSRELRWLLLLLVRIRNIGRGCCWACVPYGVYLVISQATESSDTSAFPPPPRHLCMCSRPVGRKTPRSYLSQQPW